MVASLFLEKLSRRRLVLGAAMSYLPYPGLATAVYTPPDELPARGP